MDDKRPTYEEAVKRLEEIVKKLESGAAPLDESIALFSEVSRTSPSAVISASDALVITSVPRSAKSGKLRMPPIEPCTVPCAAAGTLAKVPAAHSAASLIRVWVNCIRSWTTVTRRY